MEILLKEVIPFKDLHLVKVYLANYYSNEWNYQPQYRWKNIETLFWILCIKSIHFLYLAIFPPITYEEKMYNYDLTGLGNIPFMNWGFNFILLNLAYYLYLLYVKGENVITRIVNDIIVRHKRKFFLQKHYNSIPICEYIQSFTLMLINALQGFVFVIGIISVYV